MIFVVYMMKNLKHLLSLLLLSSCTLHQQERFSELLAPTRQEASELRNQHWVNEALRYESTAGELSLGEIDSFSIPRISHLYTLRAQGLPVGERLVLESYDPLTQKAQYHFEFQMLEDGTLQILDPKGEVVEDAPFAVKGILKGQAVDLLLISHESRSCTKFKMIPSPLLFAENGALYALEPVHRKGTHFILHGQGLAPFESFLIREESGQNISEHFIQADEKGSFSLPIEPIVLGLLGGKAHIWIQRDAYEKSHLEYAWGAKLEALSREEPFHPFLFTTNHEPQEIDALALLSKIQGKLTL